MYHSSDGPRLLSFYTMSETSSRNAQFSYHILPYVSYNCNFLRITFRCHQSRHGQNWGIPYVLFLKFSNENKTSIQIFWFDKIKLLCGPCEVSKFSTVLIFIEEHEENDIRNLSKFYPLGTVILHINCLCPSFWPFILPSHLDFL